MRRLRDILVNFWVDDVITSRYTMKDELRPLNSVALIKELPMQVLFVRYFREWLLGG